MFKLKPNYVVIPLLEVFIDAIGRYFTRAGQPWYRSLVLPSYVPPSFIFTIAWNIIFLCDVFSVLIVWNNFERDGQFLLAIGFYILNAFFNVLWSFLFFYQHNIRAALFCAVALEGTVLGIMALTWQRSRTASLLMMPYALWVIFAIYMNWHILVLNT